jgi:excisionase family DNA binding protein
MKGNQPDKPKIPKAPLDMPQYITVSQAASSLKVSKDYVRELIKNGAVRGIKLPGSRNSPVRISMESFNRILEDSAIRTGSQPKTLQKPLQQRVYHGVFSE